MVHTAKSNCPPTTSDGLRRDWSALTNDAIGPGIEGNNASSSTFMNLSDVIKLLYVIEKDGRLPEYCGNIREEARKFGIGL